MLKIFKNYKTKIMKYTKQNTFLKKQINFNLFGLGLYKKKQCFNSVGVNPRITIFNIKDKSINTINQKLKTIITGQSLKKNIKDHIIFYKKLRNIRGIRHKSLKPVRGQRTKTNAKTRRAKTSISVKTNKTGSQKSSRINI